MSSISLTTSPITVHRTDLILKPDQARVLVRPFFPTTDQRAVKIIARVLALSEADVEVQLEQVLADFSGRHEKIRDFFRERFNFVQPYMLTDQKLSESRELLIGAYFTHEYSLESAALFNPSIIPHPDQKG